MREGFGLSGYQPQQSVLNPQAGHRQTACMRNISAPHRSQSTWSSAGGVRREGVGGESGVGRGLSAMPALYPRVLGAGCLTRRATTVGLRDTIA